MVDVERGNKISEFVEYWKDKGYEKGESQKFWLSLLHDVLGLEHAERYINFEDKVYIDHTSFIDGMIPATKVMIEQKSAGKDLRKKIRQSDGSYQTPFRQAKRYIAELPLSKHPRWVVTCNFRQFLVYDMEKPDGEPEEILLENLPKEYYRLSFLVDEESIHLQKEKEISIEAGKIVGCIYDALYKQYRNPNSDTFKSLNILCVRIVFCLYAEDAGIFEKHMMFHDYMAQFELKSWRDELIKLFKVLNTKPEDRGDMYLDDDLNEFPYVNGGLFADENIEIPKITDEIRYMILTYGSEEFDWSQISPTIFGAIFESTLNPETRRKGGMHYTSIENIHKVIDPLFLDDLKKEFESICEYKYAKVLDKKIIEFQDKISKLVFLDPACGSGNFLTESYLSLRKLENKIIQKFMSMNKTAGQIIFGDFEITNPIKVSISQFYGIEINDFAVTVARTALWIAEHQMMKETESIVHTWLDFLPLKSYANIVEGNALKIDWNDVISNTRLNYIMGNPPFLGARVMNKRQKEELIKLFAETPNAGNLDYVCCWYKKSMDYINGTSIRCALVSTNSVSQGEQVAILWKSLFEQGLHIDFAHKTFQWDSEAKIKAHVHCVIIGFSVAPNKKKKNLYTDNKPEMVDNINGYLINAPDIFVEPRNKPICDVPIIGIGNKPIDGGFYLFKEDEMLDFIKQEPESQKWFTKWIGADEFINRRFRYCLWLGECPPNELRKMPMCLKRVEKVKEFRLKSTSADTVKLALTPTRFHVEKIPQREYLIIPRVSSEKRRYIPIGYMSEDVLASDSVHIIENANLYHFGVLTSYVHMAWMRVVCGRLETRYRYSKDIVYNNFPWPNPTEKQKEKIEITSKGIIVARSMFKESSLADLYDERTMPYELRLAHTKNDIAVMEAYGFDKDMQEEECVSELMKLYQQYTRE